jgi:solute:Na+ symporter, SSS family
MNLQTIDILIIFGYLLSVVVVGLIFTRKSSENLDSYFLGGKKIPFYILGISNSSSMFDVSGTMWLVYMLFLYGMKGIWMEWMWPTFNQVFFMIYLSIWVRRSNVLTGAEWMRTRFGWSKGSDASRIIIVAFALISVLGFITYAFVGIGKFAKVFLPWDISAEMYAIIIMTITTLYVMTGGMLSAVINDVFQYVLMTITSIGIGIIAMTQISPQLLNSVIPNGWKDIFFGLHLNLDWSNILPAANDQILFDGYSLFGVFFMMMVFKGVLNSMAGPGPNYDMQRVLAAKTPKEAGLMSGIVPVFLTPRWIMVPAITVLALVFFIPEIKGMGNKIDFELLLPLVINKFVPTGLLGIFLAGLLSAFMSTFGPTVNAAAAYIVNDLYKEYINPKASDKKLITISYIATVAVLIVGIICGFYAYSINKVTEWLVFGLFGGYTAPNVLKWHWWRLNATSYFWGMLSGIIVAMLLPVFFPAISAIYTFPIILFFSGITCIAVAYLTEPDDEEVLKKFYKSVRPWGFWEPIYQKVIAEDPSFRKNTGFKRDMINVFVGIIWHTALRVIPIYLIIFEFNAMGIAIAISLITMYFLKKNWYDKLENN